MQPQDLPEELQAYLASERGTLLSENRILKAKNAELLVGHENLTAEVQRLKERIEAGLNALTGSTSTQNNLPRSFISSLPPPVTPVVVPRTPSFNLDLFPNEILTEILHHLHQPFHFYYYSNALLGIPDPRPESRPWNPVELQLVCRRWKYLARPLFYRQVAFDARDSTTLNLAVEASERFLNHPLAYSKDSIWIDVHPPEDDLDSSSYADSDDFDLLNALEVHVSFRVQPQARSVALTSNGAPSMFVGCSCLERMFVLGASPLEEAGDVVRMYGKFWDVGGGFTDRIHHNHLLILRVPPYGVPTSLASIFEYIGDIPYLPRLQLDLPFALTRSLLDSIFPTLTSILQHPSLPAGRDFIFRPTGNPKKILFGTKSDNDAPALRARIDGLEGLEVVVEVMVLEV